VVTADGKVPTLEQVRQAITKAAISSGWALAKTGDAQFEATLVVRGKHTVVVSIPFSPEKFSVLYTSSTNMKYDARGGKPVIHPNYNVWTGNLVSAIRRELVKL
jgi:hypothetical protein